ncbi:MULTISPECIES: phosphoribosylformylglycinamidine cyclo-ligase [Pasteurellaceae]|uniref:Phosphoribosylformylglycinamidine cyclo-ligase n=1 Tax=Pasteurella atlantica TaxID=2827233 RepID=A0AAW8CFF8_9PAST|nr:phosphoribosylformylglycinamidine cyclo-ligase [Pasteurella atlantica]MBR0572903.1 phosphoribosylformylglycinamidine cyclo-ligase [Pasteurella atlantica]MDP8038969.1 phosphoribosylformylglycinamidine cyclo-ligase [Pasteurella atlantica]MDP8040922.1 phosphoribosylformylglycinamidine cyclo-ligase [Pasteurella atlantica]MDP8043058.1 phosphoribosylformylglycinamidine cyclo-ligase [Pasteurella atlantica]MDP8045144.1 phosphoribosylformylglycinamidine cyclo-ligase [Pasteurella atlantica]
MTMTTITYKQAGVDKEEGYKAVELMKKKVQQTHNSSVLTNLGSFGAMYALGNYKEPILVSGTDGVGTKLEIALTQKKYDTVGIDAVAMCVNDILCHGAKPLFFLDYLACGKLEAEVAAELVSGISDGCLQAGAALIGGETAEMPGFYQIGDYDIAGFCVGVVEKSQLINGDKVRAGDSIIALPSSGFHSNGFSLLRKIFSDYNEVIEGKSVSDWLLTPTKIYVKPILQLLEKFDIHAMAHITGGGLIENLPRCMNKDLSPVVFKNNVTPLWQSLPLFAEVQQRGNISEDEMFGTFNMGVGFTLVVNPNMVDDVVDYLASISEPAYVIGHIEQGDNQLCLK